MGLFSFVVDGMSDIDAFVDAMMSIAPGDRRGEYEVGAVTSDYAPRGWHPEFSDYFTVARRPAVTAS